MKITLLVHDIEWYTGANHDVAQSLPSKVAVEVDLLEGPVAGSINDQVCNQLSDITGFCVMFYKLQGYSAEADYALQMSNAPQQDKADEFHKTCEEAEEEMAKEADEYNPEGEWFNK